MHKFNKALLSLFILSAPASAQLCFQESEIISTLFNPFVSVAADVDQDGDMDIIAAWGSVVIPDPEIIKLAWYENDGQQNPQFTEHLFGNPSVNIDTFKIVDFDGDGYPDIFVETEAFSGPHLWYQNTGGATPTFIQRETGWQIFTPAAFADIDGDGDTDILQDSIRWFRYTGVGSTHFEQLSYSTQINGDITGAEDIDQDGRIDLITSGGYWYQNTSDIHPLFVEHEIPQATPGVLLRPVDLTNDGFLDLLADNDKWFLNLGAKANPESQFSMNTTTGLISDSLTPADIDLDGWVDLVSTQFEWYKNVYPNVPSFVPQSIQSGPVGPFTVRDFDGDGDFDLANPNRNVWYRNDIDGMGVVSFSEQSFIGLNPGIIPSMEDGDLVDFNNDGDLDSIRSREPRGVLNWFNNSTISNTRTGSRYGDVNEAIQDSIDEDTLLGDSGVFDCAVALFTFGRSIHIESLGDLYVPDLFQMSSGSLRAAPGSNLVVPGLSIDLFMSGGTYIEPYLSGQQIIINSLNSNPETSVVMDGDVVFAPRASISPFLSNPTPGVKQIKSGDLDNDGDVDTIVLSENGVVSWFAQSQQFNPWDGIQQSIPSAVSESFEVGDFNNDGLLDIAGHDEGELFLFLNNGFSNGVLEPFTLQTIITGEFSFGDIAVGDVDSDGDLDLIHAGQGTLKGGAGTRVFINDGNNPPSFSSVTIFNHPYFVFHINLFDIDNDEDLDILLAQDSRQLGSSGVVVLENQGTNPPIFSSEEIMFASGNIPDRVHGGDFDNDGDGDILVLYPDGLYPKVVLLESNAPDPGYRGRVIGFGAFGESFGSDLALGDFDSDGDIDFITDRLQYFENTGGSPVSFRRDDGYSDDNEGAIHTIDYQQNGSLDIARSGMEWSKNLDFSTMQFYGSAEVTGDLEMNRSKLFLPDTSMGPTYFTVGGTIKINTFSEVFATDNSFNISSIVNTGSLTFTNFTQEGGGVLEMSGSYAQYEFSPSGETTGTLRLDLHPNGLPQLKVQGTAALAGSLIVNEFGSSTTPISGEEPLGIALQASSFVTGREQFDVYTGPILTLEFNDGSTAQGTLIPMYNQAEGPTSTVTLVPITLDELLFTQNPFSSEGIPNDAVLFDITGAADGSPDGDVDLIVAIPEIPGVSPNGAVAVFQGSLDVNGFQMASASLYTGPIVDSPGSVEVGYFDSDSVPDIAFANQGTNGINNDVHFLHMDSSSPAPLSIAPIPAFDIGIGFTVSDLASDNFVVPGAGDDDLLLGVQSNGSGMSMVQTISFGSLDWESCEVDVDDVDTVTPGSSSVIARGIALADVVVTSPSSNTATYFVNIGDFENMVPITIPTGTQPTEVLAEDLNGDGEPEVVVICEGNIGNQGVVTVSRNLGGNAFAPPVNIPLGTNALVNPNPVSFALSDVDDDGDRDMVLVSVNDLGDQVVRIIRNTTVPGNGLTFASVIDAPSQPVGTPLIVRSADLDGDSPMVADDIVVLVDPVSSFAPGSAESGGGGASNSIDLSGDFCAADLRRDGSLNFLDVSAFLTAYSNQDTLADFTSDGLLNFLDVSAFLSLYGAGCP